MGSKERPIEAIKTRTKHGRAVRWTMASFTHHTQQKRRWRTHFLLHTVYNKNSLMCLINTSYG